MRLTKRASVFLSEQEYRDDGMTSLDVIEAAFSKIGIEPTKELIDFQSNYGGFIIHAGLKLICFGMGILPILSFVKLMSIKLKSQENFANKI